MKKQVFTITAISLLFFPFAVKANALKSAAQDVLVTNNLLAENGFHRRKGREKKEGMKKILQKLDLTTEQSSQIEDIHDRAHQENEKLHEEMKNQHQTMHSLFSSNADSDELLQQYQAIQNLHQELSTNRFESMLQVREILTPEQREQMSELMKNRRRGRGHR